MKLIKKYLETSRIEEIRKMASGATDVGKERQVNEDFFLINQQKHLFIVADGMGGHNAGDVASKQATQIADNYLTRELLNDIRGNMRKIRETIIKSLIHAHMKILDMADKNPGLEGMGCTIVAALILENSLHLCHVGDARAYLANENGITLLTRDHSYVMELVQKGKLTMEEARVSPMKNKLNQAIGASKSINPDYKHCVLKEGDKILLCSDGLWDMISDPELYAVLRQNRPAGDLCNALIKKANNAGGHDNITAIIIQHKDLNITEEGAEEPVDTSNLEKTGEYSFVFNKPSPGGK
ncbi:MAG: Stp1/IreP family PP2C-type Ser/Thr phosphatase [bacterium]|nr:Stp1/IreP family PP2C-type Ser/Thr phosphatase [bacterium]